MPAISASAPGKIILFGEHAVVYGRPAIAVPIVQVKAKCLVIANPTSPSGSVRIQAPDIGLETELEDLPASHPIKVAIAGVISELGIIRLPACTLRITSTIPVASGLGSGAAVSVGIIRALSAFVGNPLPDERVSALAFEVEKIHHGTPSGIDNTVVTYARPVYFQRGQAGRDPIIEAFQVARSFTIIIGDTGIATPTALTVEEVRQRWQTDKAHYEKIFDAIGAISQKAYQAIQSGSETMAEFLKTLGELMNQNHELLTRIGVSSPELECLVAAAQQDGALGAKLSGAGRGGNMIALAPSENAARIAQALQTAGAKHTILSTVGE
jgi:mevalonate kinase